MKYLLATVLALASPLVLASSNFPDLNIRTLLWNLFVLCGLGIVFGIAYYLVGAAPFINDLFKKILQYAIIAVGGILLIYLILGWIGM